MKRFRLPKKVYWPGFVIRVEEVEMTGDDMGEWIYSDNGGVIRIQRGLNVAHRKYYFGHELAHAVVDYLHKLIASGAVP